MQENSPQFRLNNLEPGREYQFLVYAVNAKGRSEPPVVIENVRVAAQLGPYGECPNPPVWSRPVLSSVFCPVFPLKKKRPVLHSWGAKAQKQKRQNSPANHIKSTSYGHPSC